jgi:hypothetical protein
MLILISKIKMDKVTLFVLFHGIAILHHASIKGNTELVVVLLRRNAKCDIKDKHGKLAIDYAIEKSTTGERFVKLGMFGSMIDLPSDHFKIDLFGS